MTSHQVVGTPRAVKAGTASRQLRFTRGGFTVLLFAVAAFVIFLVIYPLVTMFIRAGTDIQEWRELIAAP
jgi:uncharacterized protein HemY